MCSREASELAQLAELSARLGCNPLLVQAASGNTSVKTNGALWIKASGQWLADARKQNVFVRVRMDEARDPQASNFTERDLRPSIETAMHATLPHKVVVHVHSVNTIVWGVRQDGLDHLARRLRGLPWVWIPHTPSGWPLADEIARALCRLPKASVFVLANHGLVVGAGSGAEAETLIDEVEQRLAIPPRRASRPHCAQLEHLICPKRWRIPADAAIHALGTDCVSRSILHGGVLFPCQAIFLGPSLHLLDLDEIDTVPEQPFAVVKERGVIVSRTISRADYEMLRGLMEVVQRLDDDVPIRYLTNAEVAEVLSEDAYRYRALVETTTSCG